MILQLFKKSFLLLIVLIFFLNLSNSILYAADIQKTKKILIIPFSFNSDDTNDLTFLKNGIDRMLYTRLTHINRTKILFDISGKEPVEAGNNSLADYVLTGSITMFDQKISTDAVLFSIKDGKEILNFGEFGNTKGDVIGHINNLATKINIDILGIDTNSSKAQHTTQPIQDQPNQYFSRPQYDSNQGYKFQSSPINTVIRSIAIGDVSNDSNNEIVFITNSTLSIVTFQNQKQNLIAETKLSGFTNSVRVDTIDIDDDGKDEIIVSTSIKKKFENNSVAFKYNNKTKALNKITIYPNAFYTTYIDHSNKILIGQRRSDRAKNYKGNLFAAKFIDGSIVPTESTIHNPKDANIYTFTSGDLLNNKSNVYAIYDNSGYIYILNDANIELWRTSDKYGSTPVSFLSAPAPIMVDKLRGKKETSSIWQRMHIADINDDQKNDLILVQNNPSNQKLLNRNSSYKSGNIQTFSWDTETNTLIKTWESGSHSGYIVDCIIGDLNNDGKNEIIYAVVPPSKSFLNFKKQNQTFIFAKGF